MLDLRTEQLRLEAKRIERAMKAPADTAPMFSPPPRGDDKPAFVYRLETVPATTPQRPFSLPDEYWEQFPRMASALRLAHEMRLPFEWLE